MHLASKTPGKPRVLIDARMAGSRGHGIGHYVQQLAEGLEARELAYEPFFLVPPDCPRESALRRLPHAECAVPFARSLEPLSMAGVIRSFSPSLYHSPSFSSLLRYPCPHIQTVHDLNHRRFGSLPQKAYYRFVLLPSLRKARSVLSVSEAAALELRGWLLGHRLDRAVKVAPNAVTPFPEIDDQGVLRRLGLEKEGYFFAVSSLKPHKNLALLERAYASARALRSLPPLVANVPGPAPGGVAHTGPLEAHEMGALLRNAKAFYFPSLYEGFGRPPAEAALAGTVPVASSIPAHREALSGVTEAIFLDPASETPWKESFLRQASASDRVSERSRTWIRETWSVERLARVMDEAYREALGVC